MFSVAGVSVRNDKVKVRFCSDKVLRIKNLQKQGDTDIDLIELPNPMTKEAACKFLLTLEQFAKYREDINATLGKKQLKSSNVQPIIKPVAEQVDSDLEAIKELAAA